ncbi:MAG: Maf family protein [Chloroflexota bacterium]
MTADTPPILLASASPRRRELLSWLGWPFSVVAADVDETGIDAESPPEMVQRLSREKARHVAARRPQAVVIAADTTVALDGRSLGKPVDNAEATAMLRALRNRPHQVYSGLTVIWGEQHLTDLAESLVWMRRYSDDEIAAYVASGDPLDKAGAYAVQHARFRPAERVEGCFASVMGFPLCHLTRALAGCGLRAPVDVPAVCQTRTGFGCRVFGDILDIALRDRGQET